MYAPGIGIASVPHVPPAHPHPHPLLPGEQATSNAGLAHVEHRHALKMTHFTVARHV